MLDIIKKNLLVTYQVHIISDFFDGAEICLTISGLYFSASIFNVCSLNIIQNFRNTSTFFLALGRLHYEEWPYDTCAFSS